MFEALSFNKEDTAVCPLVLSNLHSIITIQKWTSLLGIKVLKALSS